MSEPSAKPVLCAGEPAPCFRFAALRSVVDQDFLESAFSAQLLPATKVGTPVHRPTPEATTGDRRYYFYSPELNLVAESDIAATTQTPAPMYEYIWFGGQPVAQEDVGNHATHWTFTDHLGTPIIQTDASAQVYWRAEYEPFGKVFALRTGDQHQPLRFPGQEAEQWNLGANGMTDREYNIFRWYREGWGRYTQSDPIGLSSGTNLMSYADDNPTDFVDTTGRATVTGPREPVRLYPPDIHVPCGTAFSCTNFAVTINCSCHCTEGGWSMKLDAYLVPIEKLSKTDDRRAHEGFHVADITDRFWGYLTYLEAIKFSSQFQCLAGCFEVKGSWDSWLTTTKKVSNKQYDATPW